MQQDYKYNINKLSQRRISANNNRKSLLRRTLGAVWFNELMKLTWSLSLPPAALQALKRKKRYEKQLAQIDGTLSTIAFQREALENANTNTEVLKNMGFAAKAMKAAHENM